MKAGTLITAATVITLSGAGLVVSNTLVADTVNLPVGNSEYYDMVDEQTYPIDDLILSVQLEGMTECFAKNIYFEAGNQSLAGKYAVGHVVLNRVKSNRFPNDPCSVIYQGPVRESWKTAQDHSLPEEERIYHPVRDKCQFSWYCDGKDDVPFEGENWNTAVRVAEEMLTLFYTEEKILDITDGALYYHADYVYPYWADTMRVTARIGNHIFYR